MPYFVQLPGPIPLMYVRWLFVWWQVTTQSTV